MDKFFFLETHTRFITIKKIMVIPPLTILFYLLTILLGEMFLF